MALEGPGGGAAPPSRNTNTQSGNVESPNTSPPSSSPADNVEDPALRAAIQALENRRLADVTALEKVRNSLRPIISERAEWKEFRVPDYSSWVIDEKYGNTTSVVENYAAMLATLPNFLTSTHSLTDSEEEDLDTIATSGSGLEIVGNIWLAEGVASYAKTKKDTWKLPDNFNSRFNAIADTNRISEDDVGGAERVFDEASALLQIAHDAFLKELELFSNLIFITRNDLVKSLKGEGEKFSIASNSFNTFIPLRLTTVPLPLSKPIFISTPSKREGESDSSYDSRVHDVVSENTRRLLVTANTMIAQIRYVGRPTNVSELILPYNYVEPVSGGN